MATKQSYHQYDATHMPEIRQLRSKFLQALKFKEKYDSLRSDTIARAIIADVDFRKLGVDVNSVCTDTKEVIENLELNIDSIRAGLECYINDIFVMEYNNIISQARASSSTPAIFDAAFNMAKKYHDRSVKPKRHHCPDPDSILQLPSTTTAPLDPPSPPRPETPPPPSPVNPHTRSPPKMAPNHHAISPPQMTPKPPRKVLQATQAPSNKKPKVTTTHSPKDPSRTTSKTHQETSPNSSKPTTRPTLKAYFRTTKAPKTTHPHSLTASRNKPKPKPKY